MATTCPISRKQFADHAKPIPLTIFGGPLTADPKAFGTGSMGWHLNGKVTIEVNGVPTLCQVGLNVTIIGSKELPA